jgi:hypothetical protein
MKHLLRTYVFFAAICVADDDPCRVETCGIIIMYNCIVKNVAKSIFYRSFNKSVSYRNVTLSLLPNHAHDDVIVTKSRT